MLDDHAHRLGERGVVDVAGDEEQHGAPQSINAAMLGRFFRSSWQTWWMISMSRRFQ